MINYQDEIKHFKPSLDVDNIEDAIAGMNLTDMNDLMMQLVRNAVTPQQGNDRHGNAGAGSDGSTVGDYSNEG